MNVQARTNWHDGSLRWLWMRLVGMALVGGLLWLWWACGGETGEVPCQSTADCIADQICNDGKCSTRCVNDGDCLGDNRCDIATGVCGKATVPPPDLTTATIEATGGTVAVTNPGSPIYGAKVILENGALLGSETISIRYQDSLPGSFNEESIALGAKQISKVLVLSRTGTYDFKKPVVVTLPFDKTLLQADAVPIVIYWDPTISGYSPMAIHQIDRSTDTVKFITAHFSKFVIIVLDKLFRINLPNTAKLSIEFGFDPVVDSFFVGNFASYRSEGNCFGMAAYSAWYHKAKKQIKGKGLMGLYREGDIQCKADDQIVRELIAKAYDAGEQKNHLEALKLANAFAPITKLRDIFTGYQLISQLITTRQAQILAMGTGGISNGHAVTVYAYDDEKNQFLFYDNNYPGQQQVLSWDRKNGFGIYTNAHNTEYDTFGFAAFNSAYSPSTLENIYNEAESGFQDSTYYPKITITSPTESLTDPTTLYTTSDKNVEIKGSVPRPAKALNPTAQRYVVLYLDDICSELTHHDVDDDNDSFSIPIAKLPKVSGTTVILLVFEKNEKSGKLFHAFKKFTIRVGCAFDAHCKDASTPKCNTTTEKCVQCLTDGDCSGQSTKPKCDTTKNLCVAICKDQCSQSGQTICTDFQNDPANCGRCENRCDRPYGSLSGEGFICVAGVCRCPTGQTACTRKVYNLRRDYCVDLKTNRSFCGSCYTLCPNGAECVAGVCRCPSGQTACEDCADLQTSLNHCGACGRQCSAEYKGKQVGICVGGVCKCSQGVHCTTNRNSRTMYCEDTCPTIVDP